MSEPKLEEFRRGPSIADDGAMLDSVAADTEEPADADDSAAESWEWLLPRLEDMVGIPDDPAPAAHDITAVTKQREQK